ncbi:MAG: hypothetical protein AVDCRST_MAG19-4139, partial [uncultured Thermomicrobiales bacterium]
VAERPRAAAIDGNPTAACLAVRPASVERTGHLAGSRGYSFTGTPLAAGPSTGRLRSFRQRAGSPRRRRPRRATRCRRATGGSRSAEKRPGRRPGRSARRSIGRMPPGSGSGTWRRTTGTFPSRGGLPDQGAPVRAGARMPRRRPRAGGPARDRAEGVAHGHGEDPHRGVPSVRGGVRRNSAADRGVPGRGPGRTPDAGARPVSVPSGRAVAAQLPPAPTDRRGSEASAGGSDRGPTPTRRHPRFPTAGADHGRKHRRSPEPPRRESHAPLVGLGARPACSSVDPSLWARGSSRGRATFPWPTRLHRPHHRSGFPHRPAFGVRGCAAGYACPARGRV